MSTRDTMTPIISSPWLDANGNALPVRSLPGLRPEVLKTLESAYPGLMRPALKELLATCCGLADTDLGHIDFTGWCFPEEPCGVFHPCVTIAIDDTGRRWIAEFDGGGVFGPVWCIFPNPAVAVYISDDLGGFLATLRDHACRGQTLSWLKELTATARAVWSHRRTLALRPFSLTHADEELRGWVSSLPADAYVYDLRAQTHARAWPYGVAGPSGRLFRCGRLPVFAAAGSPTEGWRTGHPRTTLPIYPIAHQALSIPGAVPLVTWQRPTVRLVRRVSPGAGVSAGVRPPLTRCTKTAPEELPLCA